MRTMISALALTTFAGLAAAQFSVTVPDQISSAPDSSPDVVVVDISSLDFTTPFTNWTVTYDWALESGNPWSSEERVGLNNPVGLASPSSGGLASGANTTLTFNGTFASPLDGTDTTLDFYFGRTFTLSGASGSLTNISIDFGFPTPPPTLADLSIGTLVAGDMVMGDTSNSSDDITTTNGNAFTGSGANETGGDDVYALSWGGGDLTATLDIMGTNPATGLPVDLDLFLYDENEDLVSRAFTTANPEIIAENLPAGDYFLRVDGFLGDAGAYKLTVVPAPGAVALLGLAGLAGVRRRRA